VEDILQVDPRQQKGGICIDMSKLRKVSVDPKAKIVVAEGGALWADVDKAAAEH